MKLPQYITVNQIAVAQEASVRTVRRWIRSLELRRIINPFRPTHKTLRISPEDYEVLKGHSARIKGTKSKPQKWTAAKSISA